MRLITIIKNVSVTSILSLLLFSAQASFALPAAFQANYSVAKGSMNLGNLHASLKYSGNNYQYHKFTQATGLAALLTGIKITENTDGQFSGQNISPKNYLFNQTQRSKARIDKVQFTANRAVGSYKNTPYNVAITPETQDRASLELVLARDIAQNKPQLVYTVVDRGEIKQYNFQKLGHEQIQTPAGNFSATKVRVIRSDDKRDTVFWMAKEIDYLPVKIQHREKGDVITTVIKNYKKL